MTEKDFEGEEHGGEEMGYRTPLAVRQEGTGPAPATPAEEGAEPGPGDEEGEGVPAGEEVSVDGESLLSLEGNDLDLLIDQEELSVDKGLDLEDKRIEVAKALGFEVVIEEDEGAPGPEGEGVEELQGRIKDLNRELAMLRPAQELMRVLEEDPAAALQDLAGYYGVELSAGTPAAAAPAAEVAVEIPAEEPRPGETMPQYLARLMQAGFASMQKGLAAKPAAAPARPAKPAARRPHPQVVATLQYLDKNYPDWEQFERKMLELVRVDPTLMNNPDLLYERASGRKGGPGARAKARERKITLKRASTGERAGRAPLRLARKGKVLDPSRGADFAKAWDLAKKQVAERGG